MRIIEAESAESYLREAGRLDVGERIKATNLAGGVSNVVIRCESNCRPAFVLKQSRPQLRTKEPWFCSPERIWREVLTLRICERTLQRQASGSIGIIIPQVLFEDRENFAFGMTAAVDSHRTWKADLLAGNCRESTARQCGTLLGQLHSGTWHDRTVAQELDERQFFDALRIDPYYRFTAQQDVIFGQALEQLVQSVWSQRHCLVHGDFSPKNLLVADQELMLIDFEVGHYGDPAFDLGFFVTHLVLKAIHHWPQREAYLRLADRFWAAYEATMSDVAGADDYFALVARGLQNLAGCLLARVAGKSRIDYAVDETKVRSIVQFVFERRPTRWAEARESVLRL